MEPAWVRDVCDRCAELGIPFFFKQAGGILARQWAMGDRNGHNLDALPAEFRVRQMPCVDVDRRQRGVAVAVGDGGG